MKYTLTVILVAFFYTAIFSQQGEWAGRFEQLGQELPTPNSYRAADGAPGSAYWQQQADYKLKVKLDDETQRVTGSGEITYHNNSPQTLTYLWLQLDQNRRASHSDDYLTKTNIIYGDTVLSRYIVPNLELRSRVCGMNIHKVTDVKGKALAYVINKTMMRVDLSEPLTPGKSIGLKMTWDYNLNDRMEEGGRSGYEYFPKDGNYLYAIAQFYPRMAVYDDVEGWQNKQFLGTGEFTLPFGNFEVEITVPDDHLIAATGDLQNAKSVLTKSQYKKYERAKRSFDSPIIIATEDEARAREKERSKKYQTWQYIANNVRDFAFTSSRKFVWDAQAVRIGNHTTLAMSLYPKEGNPLWEQESTKAVINTLKTYSKFSINYPYPVATSVHSANIGMEYPMICFNFGRPNSDGSYSDAIKYGMIGVIIHEVGHNFFPMIVNSDERQWGWMDEGINSYLEYVTERDCYDNFPHSRGPAATIVNYMKGDQKGIRPMMTNPEQVTQLGNNAYGKPAAALNILREVIMGPVLFDSAFKTFSQRWAFKHPKPADFFRSMEDASGVDLDWFWRGWFYGTDYVDMQLDTVIWYRLDDDTDIVFQDAPSIQHGPSAGDVPVEFPDRPARFTVIPSPDFHYWEYKDRLDHDALLKRLQGKNFYQIKVSNMGGLVMPIIVQFVFEDDTEKTVKLPAEIWRYNEYQINKVFYFDKKVKRVEIDPARVLADVDHSNNLFPTKQEKSRFDTFKEGKE